MKRTDEMTSKAPFHHRGRPVYYCASFDVSEEVTADAESGIPHIAFVHSSVGLEVVPCRRPPTGGGSELAMRSIEEIKTGISRQPDRYEVFDPAFTVLLKRFWGLTPEMYQDLVGRCVEALDDNVKAAPAR